MLRFNLSSEGTDSIKMNALLLYVMYLLLQTWSRSLNQVL